MMKMDSNILKSIKRIMDFRYIKPLFSVVLVMLVFFSIPVIASWSGTAYSHTDTTQADFTASGTTKTYTNATAAGDIELITNPTLSEDVEDANYLFPFTNSGDASWYRDSSKKYAGTYSFASGTIINNKSTNLQTTVNIATGGTVSFYYLVSSESAGDYFRFYLDGVQQLQASGTSVTSFTYKSYSLSAGIHTLKWTYSKDADFIYSGSDKAWIDNLTVTGLAASQLAASGTYESQVFDISQVGGAQSGTISWNAGLPANTSVALQTNFSLNGGTSWGGWVNVSNGAISGIKPANLSNARLKYKAVLTSSDGTSTPSLHDVTINITNDTTAPSITFAPPQYLNTSSSYFNATVTDDGSGVIQNNIMFLVDTDPIGVPASFYNSSTGLANKGFTLADGTHIITVKATDNAGNTTTSQTYTFTVDTSAPTATSLTPQYTHANPVLLTNDAVDPVSGLAEVNYSNLNVSNDFNDGVKGANWTTYGSADFISESGGVLNVNIPANGNYGGYQSLQTVSGDFDIQVDFSNFTYSGTDNGNVTLLFSVDGNNQLSISRNKKVASPATNNHQFTFRLNGVDSSSYATFSANDPVPSGTMRIKRTGSSVAAFYKAGPYWVQINTWNGFPTAPGTVSLYASASTDAAVSAKFDNLIIWNSPWETYSATKNLSLPGDGEYSVYARFKDNAGNISTGYVHDPLFLDTVAPSINIIKPDNGSNVSTNYIVQAAMTDATAGIDSGTIVFKIDGAAQNLTPIANYYDSATGLFTCPVSLAPGSHNLYLEVKDKSGLKGTTTTWAVTALNNLAPTINLLAPTNGQITKTPDIQALMTDNDGSIDSSSIVLKIDGAVQNLTPITNYFNPATGAFSYHPTLSDGTHNLSLEAKDNAGIKTIVSANFTYLNPNYSHTDTTQADFTAYGTTRTSTNAAAAGDIELATTTSLFEDFEDTNYLFPFTNSGNAIWYRDSGQKYAGSYGFASGTISNSQSTTLQTTVNIAAGGTVSFYYLVSSESGWDFLRFYIDGVQQLQASGTSITSFTYKSYSLSAGTHTLKWTYSKDSSGVAGSDKAWIDNLTVTGLASQYAASGTYESQAFNISQVVGAQSGTISWNAGLPANTSVAFQTNLSLDGGTTWKGWKTATNGGTIPDIKPADLNNARLKYKATLSSSNGTSTPSLHDVTINITNDATAPSLTFSPPQYFTTNIPTFEATVTDNGSGVSQNNIKFLVDTDPAGVSASYYNTFDGRASKGITLAEGTHTVTVKATDNAGNTTTSPTYTFTVDASAPAATSLTPQYTHTNPVPLTNDAVDLVSGLAGISYSNSSFSDDFNDGVMGANWTNYGNGNFISESGVALNLNIPANGNTYSGYQSLQTVSGDFDIQVDFSDFTYSGMDNGNIALLFSVDNDNQLSVSRNKKVASPATNNFKGTARKNSVDNSLYAIYNSNDLVPSGKIRITRTGSTVSSYYNTGSGWELIGSWTGFSTAPGTVRLYASGSTDAAVSAKFDNLIIWNTTWETYSATKNLSLPGDGQYSVYARFKDNAGNISDYVHDHLVLDTVAPSIDIIKPDNGGNVSTNYIIQAAITDATAGIDTGTMDFKIDGAAQVLTPIANYYDSATGLFTYPVSLAPGPHDLYLEVQDKSGLKTTTTTWTFNAISNFAPTINLLSPTSGQNTNAPTVQALMADSDGSIDNSSIVLKIDGVAQNLNPIAKYFDPVTGGFFYRPTVSDGTHNLSLEAKDNAGIKTAAFAYSVTVDTTAPVVSGLTPANGASIASTSTISAKLTDILSGVKPSSVILKIDGNTVPSTYDPWTGLVSYTPTVNLGNGSHYISVAASDNAGNQTTANWSFNTNTANWSHTDTTQADFTAAGTTRTNVTATASPGEIKLASSSLLEDFEDDNYTLTFTHSGTLPWTRVDNQKYAGAYSFASGAVTQQYQSSTTQTTVTIGSSGGTVSFYKKFVPTGSGNTLYFVVDGITQYIWNSPYEYWVQASLPLSAGTHTLKWEYYQWSATSPGTPVAWIDNVNVTGAVSTGTYQSQTFDIAHVGYAQSSSISWNASVPANTSLAVQTNLSTDGGTTWQGWQTASSGGAIPGIANTSLSNARLKYRITMTSSNGSIPQLNDLTMNIISSTAAPTITGVGPQYATTSTPVLQATVTDGSSTITQSNIKFCIDGDPIGVPAATYSGNVATYSPTLADGVHTLTVKATNNMGNSSTAAMTFYVDTAAPAVTSLTPRYTNTNPVTVTNNASDTGTGLAQMRYSNDTVSDDFNDGIKGSQWYEGFLNNISEANGALNINAQGTATEWGVGQYVGRLPISGDFDIQVDFSNFMVSGPGWGRATLELGVDTQYIEVSRIKSATTNEIQSIISGAGYSAGLGNAEAASGKLRINRTGSTVTTYYDTGAGWQLLAQNTSFTNSPGYLRLYGAADYNVTLTTSFDNLFVGTPWEAYSPTKSLTLSPGDGEKAVSAHFSDNAGNITTIHYPITLDTAAPTMDIANPVNGTNTSINFNVAALLDDTTSGINSNTIIFKVDGVARNLDPIDNYFKSTIGTFIYPITLTEGPHDLYLEARDKAGNLATTATWHITATNNYAPTIEIISPANGQSLNSVNPPVQAKLTDSDGSIDKNTIALKIDGMAKDLTPIDNFYNSTTGAFTYPSTMGEGTHHLYLEVKDTTGIKNTTGNWTVNIDHTGPAVEDLDPEYTSSLAPTLSAKVTDGLSGVIKDNIKFYIDTNPAIHPEAGLVASTFSGGIATYMPPAELEAGSHALTVVATDNIGNATTSSILTFYVDRTGPAVTDLSPLSTNNLKPVLSAKVADSGSGVTKENIKFYIDFNSTGASADDFSNGVATYTPVSNLPEGEGTHSLTVEATDNAGNTTSASIIFFVDNTAPTVTVLGPQYTSSLTPILSANVSDAFITKDTIKFYIDTNPDTNPGAGLVASSFSGGLATCTPGLTEGSHTLIVKATDYAGNSTTTLSFTFYVDQTGPDISGLTPADGAATVLKPTISANLADALSGIIDSTVVMKLDGTAVGSYNAGTKVVSHTPTTNLSSGVHNVSVTASDNSGNETTTNWSFTASPSDWMHTDTTQEDFTATGTTRTDINATLGEDIELAATGSIYEDFEDYNYAFTFDFLGSSSWERTNNPILINGLYSYGTPWFAYLYDNKSFPVQTTVNLASSGTVSFRYRISSQYNKDFLRFYIDGIQQFQDSGEAQYFKSFNLSAGAHTLKWEYVKDASGNAGYDKVVIDNLQVTGVYASSGTYESQVFDISQVACAQNSSISWNADVPANTTLDLQTNLSLDGGTTWQGWRPATNGGAIQGITLSDLSNARLKYKATLTSSDNSATTTLHDLTLNITTDHTPPTVTGLGPAYVTTNNPVLQAHVSDNQSGITQPNIKFLFDGDPVGVPAQYYDGNYSFASGAIGDNQDSKIEFTINTTNAVTISFDYIVSSESGADYLIYGKWPSYSGARWGTSTTTWTHQSFPLPAGGGIQTIYWMYHKNGSGSAGADKAWIDNITITGVNPTPIFEDFQDSNYAINFTYSGGADWYRVCNGDLATYTPTLSTGTHTMIVKATDIAGNTTTSDPQTITVDPPKPVISSLGPQYSNNLKPTFAAKVTETNASVPQSNVKFFIDGNVTGVSADTYSGGVATYTPAADLDTGSHTLTVTATDIYGTTASSTLKFYIDQTDPSVSNLGPQLTNKLKPTLSANVSDDLSGVIKDNIKFLIDGDTNGITASSYSDGVATYTPAANLTSGPHSFAVKVTDNAGNIFTSEPLTFVIDTTAPSITAITPANGSHVNNQTTNFQATLADTGGAGLNSNSIVFKVNNIAQTITPSNFNSGTGVFNYSQALNPGTNQLFLQVRDNVGNTATTVWTVTLDDISGPVISGQTPTGNVLNALPNISAHASDPSGIATATMTVSGYNNGNPFAPAVDKNGNISFDIPTPLGNGIHTVTLDVADNSNVHNVTHVSWTFTIVTAEGPHGGYDVNTGQCSACHSTHEAEGKKLLANASTITNACYVCHNGSQSVLDVKAEVNGMTSHHGLNTGVQDCITCHNPHLKNSNVPNLLSAGPDKVSSGIAYCGVCHGTGSTNPGGDITGNFAGTAHDTKLANGAPGNSVAVGENIVCLRCHNQHGSPYTNLVKTSINDNKNISFGVTGDNNTVCYACHTNSLKHYAGKTNFDESRHGSVISSTKALLSQPGQDNSVSRCVSCHNPHGTGNSRYLAKTGKELCLDCHVDSGNHNGQTISFPSTYSYRGATAYNNSGHSNASSESLVLRYTPAQKNFQAWESSSLPKPPAAGSPGVPASPSLISKITGIDTYRWATDLATGDGSYNYQMYKFHLDYTSGNIINLAANWIGYGEPATGYETELYLWNNNTLAWDQQVHQLLGNEGVLAGPVISSGVSTYVNSSNDVYVLAKSKHDGVAPAITGVTVLNAAATSATVEWNTINKPTTSTVLYSLANPDGSDPGNYPLSQTLPLNDYGTEQYSTHHSIILTTLFPGQKYYFKVRSGDVSGNVSYSSSSSFETQASGQLGVNTDGLKQKKPLVLAAITDQTLKPEKHYSLNTNYVYLQVTAKNPGSGGCATCHTPHGNSSYSAMMNGPQDPVCFSGGNGCHSDATNSASNVNIQAKFTANTNSLAHHSVSEMEQFADGTKVLCTKCHDPHMDNAANKIIDPDNPATSLAIDDGGISHYIGPGNEVYLMVDSEHWYQDADHQGPALATTSIRVLTTTYHGSHSYNPVTGWQATGLAPTPDSPPENPLSDPSGMSTNLAAADKTPNIQMYKFTVDKSGILTLAAGWQGTGENKTGYLTHLSIWNFTTGLWETADTVQQSASGSQRPLSSYKTAAVGAYCNKCHDSSPPSGVVMGNLTNIESAYASDFHGSGSGPATWKYPWSPYQYTNPSNPLIPFKNGQAPLGCQECHDPHGSSNVFHLKESVNGETGISNLTQSYEHYGDGILPPIDGSKTVDNPKVTAFCQQCHSSGGLDEWHKGCMDCHIAFVTPSYYSNHWLGVDRVGLTADGKARNDFGRPCLSCHYHGGSVTPHRKDDPFWQSMKYHSGECSACHGNSVPEPFGVSLRTF